MIGFFKFLTSSQGRWVQGFIGSGLIILALYWFDTYPGAAVGVAGLALLACGVFDICLAAPFVGLPFVGNRLRKELLRRQLRPQVRG